MEQQTATAAGQTAKPKSVLLKHSGREGQKLVFRPAPGGGKVIVLSPISPQPGDTVSNPFTVCGTFDFDGDLPQVCAVWDGDGTTTYEPVEQIIPPPDGCDWAFLFNVRSGDYTINDLEGSTLYSIDPVHVQ